MKFNSQRASQNVQLVGTDHCVFNSTQKAMGINDFRKIPNGVNGNDGYKYYSLPLFFFFFLSYGYYILGVYKQSNMKS